MAETRETTPTHDTMATAYATLPAERAFVVQLRADADLEREIFRGRVEHVVSGVATTFESVGGLVAFMLRELAVRVPTEP